MHQPVNRTTRETSIRISLTGNSFPVVDTPCGFLSHMLEQFSFHSGIGLEITAKGDTHVDFHHLVEDCGIVLGRALRTLPENRNIHRYGWSLLPMDGSLAQVAVDVSGRGFLAWNVSFPTEKCGDFDLELLPEFFRAFCRESGITIHVDGLRVDNSHHMAEAVFKGFGRSLAQALLPSEGPSSTKDAGQC